MFPIYYRGDETKFTSNGLGRLTDCISCVVTEERNGIYECEFTYPITGKFYQQLLNGGIVGVIHDDHHDIQPFDIYKHSAPIDGIVTFNASHINYRQGNIILNPFSASTCAEALSLIPENSIGGNPFTYCTDKASSGSFNLENPDNVKAILCGQQGSILDAFSTGDYEFDVWNVKLYAQRGVDTGVTIRYGKNLTNVEMEQDRSGTFTAIAPYYKSEDTLVTLPEGYIYTMDAPPVSYPWQDENGNYITDEYGEIIYFSFLNVTPVAIDFTSDFDTPPTVEELRARATAYLNNNKPWLPTDNITVDFVQLWQTPEYENVAALQRVSLCDTVSVYYPELGVVAPNEKVIRVVYNVLLERYDEMELGMLKTTLSEAMTGEIEQAVAESQSLMQSAIQHATEMISGGLGGYVVMTMNASGQPQEILIMDTPDVNTAINVIRMNQNGIGFSTNGYQGPFESAWTIDGRFNADFISTGNLLANFIKGGTLTLGGLNNEDGVFRLNNASGNAVVTMNNQGISTTILNASQYIKVDGDYNSSIKIPFTSDKSQYALFDKTGFSFALQNAKLYNGLGYLGTKEVGIFSVMSEDSSGRIDTDIFPGRINIAFFPSGSSSATYRAQYRNDGFFLDTPSNVQFVGADTQYSTFGITGTFTVTGTKSRLAKTEDYGERLLYCYETPSPLFGDVGDGVIGEDGLAYIMLDPKFSETITTNNYQVFIQMYGEGNAFVFERRPGYFIVKGTPGLAFGWEMKAKQKDFDQLRLEKHEQPFTPPVTDFGGLAITHIEELKEGRLSA